MISNYVDLFFKSANETLVTDIILIIMIEVFLLALWWKFRRKRVDFTQEAPIFLTSLGMLGTFAGLAIGLQHFNTESIGDSIAFLLKGLKTGFSTSFVGLFLSLLYKAICIFIFKLNEKNKYLMGIPNLRSIKKADSVKEEDRSEVKFENSYKNKSKFNSA